MPHIIALAPRPSPTGIPGLDEVLGGGIPEGNVVLVEGEPGTGKTLLALEYVYRGSTELHEPGLVVSFDTTPRRLQRDGAAFGWDLAAAEDSGLLRLVHTAPSVLLEELLSHDGALATEIQKMGARRVVVDSLAPLRLLGERPDGRSFREILHLLIECFERHGVTCLLVDEEASNRSVALSGRHLCDTVIELGRETVSHATRRTLDVVKSRGHAALPGRHGLKLEPGVGVQVHPCPVFIPRPEAPSGPSARRAPTGIPGLDGLLGGGLPAGSLVFCAGPSGSGKSLAALQFLGAVPPGERAVLFACGERSSRLVERAAACGVDLSPLVAEGRLSLLDSGLAADGPEVALGRLGRLLRPGQVSRTVVDDCDAWPGDTASGLLRALAVLTAETSTLALVTGAALPQEAAGLCDTVLQLHSFDDGHTGATRPFRTLTVPKTRGRGPSRAVELVLTDHGLQADSKPLEPRPRTSETP